MTRCILTNPSLCTRLYQSAPSSSRSSYRPIVAHLFALPDNKILRAKRSRPARSSSLRISSNSVGTMSSNNSDPSLAMSRLVWIFCQVNATSTTCSRRHRGLGTGGACGAPSRKSCQYSSGSHVRK